MSLSRRAGLALAALLAAVGLVLVACATTGAGTTSAPAPDTTPTTTVDAAPPAPAGPVTSTTPTTADAAPPATLRIPTIGVTSPVNPVGLNPDRTLEVPAPGPLYDQAAWYRDSPSPGASGPSVLLGHVDSAANGPSVFYRLGELRRGDTAEVTLADGAVRTFVVDDVREFDKDAFPQRLVYGDVPRPELRLITCGGSFDASAGSYRENVVVFAHLV